MQLRAKGSKDDGELLMFSYGQYFLRPRSE